MAGITIKMEVLDEDYVHKIPSIQVSRLDNSQLPRLDMMVVVWRNEEELTEIFNNHTGLLNYIKEYWIGFFLILLVKVLPDNEVKDCVDQTNSSDLYNRAAALSSDCHKIIIHESDLSDNGDLSFVTESIARFFGHCRIFNCDKHGEGSKERERQQDCLTTKTHWTCPGLCQLSTYQTKIGRRKKTIGFFKTVRRALTMKKISRKQPQNGVKRSSDETSARILSSNG